MSDHTAPLRDLWMTYTEAAERLGLRTPEAAAARARRAKWPKRIRNIDGAAEVLVPSALLAEAHKRPPGQGEPAQPPTSAPTLADAVRAALAPLEAALDHERAQASALRSELDRVRHERDMLAIKAPGLEAQVQQARHEAVISANSAADAQEALARETQDRRTLQSQADALRDQIGTAQLDAATATGQARTERALREAAEAKARDLQSQLDQLQARRRRWWPFG